MDGQIAIYALIFSEFNTQHYLIQFIFILNLFWSINKCSYLNNLNKYIIQSKQMYVHKLKYLNLL